MATDDRPILTCAGNQSLFASVHPYIVDALALQKTDWQRSYGRPVKKVRLQGHFVPFDVHQLPRKFNEQRLLKDPVLHLYWIDCDIDSYKKKVRDDLFMWQSAMKALSILDWLIIVVVRDENKVKTKILRTSVFDKVKGEFGSKGSARCVLFSEPFRNDTKSEAWTIVISRIQELMLASFSRIISKFEDAMRLERERRTEESWTFTNYFMLQESLAKFYNIMELYEDALVQYDELDALFAQFVVNHSVGAKTEWLKQYSHLSSGWEGMSMSTDVNMYRHMLISEDKPSLLDLRNYMFSMQCQLLIKLERPSELTSRSLKFIHNTIHELGLLEVSMPAGAVSCWVFLTCKELLSICEPFKDTLGMEVYSTYTSHLWTCLQSVTHKLGCLCGLLPDSTPRSKELHSVVELISGISSSSTAVSSTKGEMSPQQRLRRVLSSKQEFCSYYVELTELTMGTLKYIGHTRMAKVLGQQLAMFYMASGEAQQAEPFLLDSLQLFTNDQWTSLELDTWVQLAQCEQELGNHAAYIRACLKVACHSNAPLSRRLQFTEKITQFSLQDVVTVVEDCAMSVVSNIVKYETSTKTATIELRLHSKLPATVDYDNLSLLLCPHDNTDSSSQKVTRRRKGSFQSVPLTIYSNVNNLGEQAAGLTCVNTHTLLSHKDSSNTGHMIRNLSKNKSMEICQLEQEMCASLASGQLLAGINELVFTLQEPSLGRFRIHQIRLQRSGIDLFVGTQILNSVFTIDCYDPPSITIDNEGSQWYLGTTNYLNVIVSGDHCCATPLVSSAHAETSILNPTTLDGAVKTFQLCVSPAANPILPGSQTIQVDLTFTNTKTSSEELTISQDIVFHCPIEITSKTFTARQQKFIQITVFSLINDKELEARNPILSAKTSAMEDSLEFEGLNNSTPTTWKLTSSSELSFLWRLQSTDICNSETVKCNFSLDFCSHAETDKKYPTFSTDISVDIVKTQYLMTRYIKSGIPMSPLSLSRQSSQDVLSSSPDSPFLHTLPNTWQALCECEMCVELQACGDFDFTDDDMQSRRISYEIISDPNWAISGNKHGLLELTTETLLSSIGIKLMPLTSGHLWLPEVRLRNSNDEEFLPGQVYDNSKRAQVFISPEE